ncbi:hypothetical protein [Mycobacterium tuberculosis]|uniref:hypothetical protein n=1 Tax=Mycobacterium tuberculosis TaxID=1773 RepID=UPI0008A9A0E2|nr:hypothetical protein [Mycobacterium tuberculosis]
MTVRAVFRRTVGAQWPILLVGSIFAVGFVLAGANFWRRGALLIGIGVGVAADFVTTVTVAAAMVYIASTIDPLGTG